MVLVLDDMHNDTEISVRGLAMARRKLGEGVSASTIGRRLH